MMSKTRGWTLVAAVTLLGAAACSTIKGEPELRGWATEPAREVAPTPALDERDLVVDLDPEAAAPAAFAFDAVSLDGTERAGAELYAARPLIVTFVVPSCPVCTTEAPELGRAAAARPGLTFVIVHSGGTVADYQAWIDAGDLRQPNVIHLVDEELSLWARFGVTSQPSSVLVDGDGTLRRVVGALGEDGLERAAALVLR